MKPFSRNVIILALILAVFGSGCSRDKNDARSSYGFDIPGKDNKSPVPGKSITIKQVDAKTVIVAWDASSDNKTLEKNLQYKLVFSEKNNISSLEGAEKYGRTAMGWTPGVLTRQVRGIPPSTTYYFTALVRDQAGNVAVYAPQMLSNPDVNPPVVKGAVSFSNITRDGFFCTWPPATDDVTLQENLQYKLLYMASNKMKMQNDVENSGTTIMDWSIDTKSRQVSGVQPLNAYYYVVLVRDEAGNKSAYSPQKISEGELNPPSPDEGVFITDVTDRSANISWKPATDDVTPSEKLTYKVVYSKNRDIFTLQDAEANGQTATGWTANISSHIVKGLEPSTPYYFVTIVKDEAGNASLYDVQEATTQNFSGREEDETE